MTPREQLRAGRLTRRMVQLFAGLSLFGVGNVLQIRSGLGTDPWNVLHVGLSQLTSLSLGVVIVLVGLAVMALWWPLRQWPGVGTVANAVWIGIATDIVAPWIPTMPNLLCRVLALAGAIGLTGLGCALYIGAQLGPGPRDGLMTGISARTGRSIHLVRTSLELTVLALGWLLGGAIGVGTVVFALTIGPVVSWLLPRCVVALPPRPHQPDPS